ncbi:MAG: DUF6798 domain-containing protein [Pirellulaceae bacterium]
MIRAANNIADSDCSESEWDWRQWSFAVSVTFLVILCFCGLEAPDVNESHYLTKAKHFWDVNWCSRDLFLESASAHIAFFVCFGWMFETFSLTTGTWIGRLAVWALVAIAWSNLLRGFSVRVWATPLLASLWLVMIDRANLAGEWVVGGLEAKSVAYAFLLFAMSAALHERWGRFWILSGIATLFHFLVGFWFVVAWLIGLSVRRLDRSGNNRRNLSIKPSKASLWALGVFCMLALAGAYPSLAADWGTDSGVRQLAAEVQVRYRLVHHQLFAGFSTYRVASFVSVIGVALVLLRIAGHGRLQNLVKAFFIGSLFVAFLGLILSAVVDSKSAGADYSISLLRLYWFRMADFAVPTSVVLLLGLLTIRIAHLERIQRVIIYSSFSLLVLAFAMACIERQQSPGAPADVASLPPQPNPEKFSELARNWIAVCDWVRENTPEDSLFICPADQQTFKWFAQRAEVVCWKDMPQDAKSVAVWWRRVQAIIQPQRTYSLGLMAFSDEQLRSLANSFGADYIIVLQSQYEQRPVKSGLERVYPDEQSRRTSFVVLKTNRE